MRVIAKRILHWSLASCSESHATRLGSLPTQAPRIRAASSAPPSATVRSERLPSPPSPPRMRRRCPSKRAFSRSACEWHAISLMAIEAPATSSAAHTAPKLPMPRGRNTRHLVSPMRTTAPSWSSTSRAVASTCSCCDDEAKPLGARIGDSSLPAAVREAMSAGKSRLWCTTPLRNTVFGVTVASGHSELAVPLSYVLTCVGRKCARFASSARQGLAGSALVAAPQQAAMVTLPHGRTARGMAAVPAMGVVGC
mmetsp:Transcript_6/g.14  ORF Transcript_6/g.14 Transcript_6/m.14 type:complete len:253 (-) Transcript_6:177-935(-)